MPFITEEIWSHVKGKDEAMLIASPFPEHDPEINFAEDCETVELAKEIIRAIRNIRAETAAETSKKFPITISSDGKIADRLKDVSDYIKNIAKVTEITFVAASLAAPKNEKSFAHEKFNLYVLTSDLIDPASKEKELAKLLKEKASAEQQIAALEKRTSNKNFTEKAPKEIVEKELRNLEAKRVLLAKLEERVKSL
jgi:valyl-tRNA synthetase